MVGANPPMARREGTLERGQEMARRPPGVIGHECAPPAQIQVEPRIVIRPEPNVGSGRFLFQRPRPQAGAITPERRAEPRPAAGGPDLHGVGEVIDPSARVPRREGISSVRGREQGR